MVKIPKGWRRLRARTVIRSTDKFYNPNMVRWQITNSAGRDVGWDAALWHNRHPHYNCLVYIRQIKKRK